MIFLKSKFKLTEKISGCRKSSDIGCDQERRKDDYVHFIFYQMLLQDLNYVDVFYSSDTDTQIQRIFLSSLLSYFRLKKKL